jgi:hypothetical protein
MKRADFAALAVGVFLVWIFWPRKKGKLMITLTEPIVITAGDTNAE